MKKTIAFILAALILVNAAACKDRSDTQTSGSRPTSTAVTTDTGTPPTTGTAALTTAGTDPTAPIAPSTPALPPAKQITYLPVEGRESLWELVFDDGILPEDAVIENGEFREDRLLLTTCVYTVEEDQVDEEGDPFWETDYSICLIDLKSGGFCGSYGLGRSLCEAGFLDDGSVYAVCLPDGQDGFEFLRFAEFPEGRQSFTGVGFDGYCGMGGDGTVWVLDTEKGILQGLTPFDDRPDYQYDFPDRASASYYGTYDGTVFFQGYGNKGIPFFMGIDLSDGKQTVYPHLRNAGWGYKNLLSIDASDEWLIAFPEDPWRVNAFPKRHGMNSIHVAAGTRFAEYDFDSDSEDVFGTYTVYEATNGSELGRILVSGDMNLSAICMDGKENLLFVSWSEEGNSRIYLWKYNSGEPTACEDFRIIDVRNQDEECAQMAAEIYGRHGIRVYFDELSLVNLVWDYTCEYIEDGYTIARAMKVLSDALEKYPAGMFDEMLTEGFGALEIYLCGNFTPTDGTGISSAVALTSTRDGAIIMAFNVYYLEMMEQTLAHELMHVMEHRLAIYCNGAGIPYLTEWAAMNPKGFRYYDSYHDENGDEVHDTANTTWENPRGAWFVDPYSKSFATEDRARIFEHLFMGEAAIFESPHLRAKAVYLCSLIRAAFPSVGQTDRVSWEIFS